MADGCHAAGDVDGCQAATIHESKISNICHAVGYVDGCQAATIFESRNTDGDNAVRYGDGSQTATIPKSITPDVGYSVCFSIIVDRFGDTDFACVFTISRCDGNSTSATTFVVVVIDAS